MSACQMRHAERLACPKRAVQATAQPARGSSGLEGTPAAGATGDFKGKRSVMGWDLTGSRAGAYSGELMRINALGISFEGRAGLSTAVLSWVA